MFWLALLILGLRVCSLREGRVRKGRGLRRLLVVIIRGLPRRIRMMSW